MLRSRTHTALLGKPGDESPLIIGIHTDAVSLSLESRQPRRAARLVQCGDDIPVADNGDIPVRGPGKWNTRVGITMKGPIEIRC